MNLICPICGHNHQGAWAITAPHGCRQVTGTKVCGCEVTLADALAAEQARATWALVAVAAAPIVFNEDVALGASNEARFYRTSAEQALARLTPPEVQDA